MGEKDLQVRLFHFAINVIKMFRGLKGGSELLVIRPQLIKSVTSSGANYDEAQGAVSRADFSCKVGISLKEMRESNYWLKILHELYAANAEIELLLKESEELKNIFGSIAVKVSNRK